MSLQDRGSGIRSRVRVRMGGDGVSLDLPNGKARLVFPQGALPGDVDVELADATPIAPYGQFERSLLSFKVDITDGAGAAAHSLAAPATLTVSYDAADVRGIIPTSLGLYHWNTGTKRWDPLKSQHDLKNRQLTAAVSSFSDMGMWGDPYHVVPATIKGFETDLYSGSASVNIPLEVPPGPNGFGPKLALSYSSGRVNEMKSQYARGSWVGVGWSLSLGSIRLDEGDGKHTLELNGISDELLDIGNNMWRTKHESFLKIQRLDAGSGQWYWQVCDKSGTLYRFGFKGDTRQGDTILVNDGSRQFHKTWNGVGYGDSFYRWDLDYVRDTDGNEMEVTWEGCTASDCSGSAGPPEGVGYCSDYDQNAYPKEIHYSLNDTGGYQRKIVFDITGRSDVPSGPFVAEVRRLVNIRMYVGTNLVRRYQFDYQENPNYLILTGLTQSGTDNASGLPRWTFAYTSRGFKYFDWYHEQHNYRQQDRSQPFLDWADNGQGGRIQFQFDPFPAVLFNPPGFIGWTRQRVTSKQVFDGLSANPLTTTYAYEGFQDFHPTDDSAWERTEFRGHDRVTVTYPDGHVAHHHFYKGMATSWPRKCEDANPIGSAPYADTAPDADDDLLEGKEFEVVTKVGGVNSAIIARTYRRWEVVNGHPRSPGDRSYVGGYNEGYATATCRRTDFAYDSYGNLVQKLEFPSKDAHYYRKTDISISYNTSAYIVDKPRQINVYAWDSSTSTDVQASRKSYYYDNLGWAVAPTQGHVSLMEEGVSGQLSVVWYYGYDRNGNWVGFPYGNTRWAKDPKGNVTETVYDSTYHTFPVKTVDPLLRETNVQYDYVLGKPTQITDPNGAVTRHEYDVFGRIVKTRRPGDTYGDADAATIVHRHHTATVPNKVVTGIRKDAGGPSAEGWPTRRYQHVFYDGLGREVQRQVNFETSTCPIRTADISQLRSGVNTHNPGQTWTDILWAQPLSSRPSTTPRCGMQFKDCGTPSSLALCPHGPAARHRRRVAWSTYRTWPICASG
ncbi:MAG: hypothetical protein HYX94_07735 [Chloroflexi bacterium]|nr:hypothetical protein [Chloroflexota bacterium]